MAGTATASSTGEDWVRGGQRRRSSSSGPGVSFASKPPFRSTAPPPGAFDPPSPRTLIDHSGSYFSLNSTSTSIPIPASGSMSSNEAPIAGPSSEGAIARRASEVEAHSPPVSPSSAPAVPSVIAVAHPSLYIHTQHPRRGSMTPLGLHVISPVPPNTSQPVRSVGFSPSYQPHALPSSSSNSQSLLSYASDPLDASARRGSSASTCSTLTQSRPPTTTAPGSQYHHHSHYPAGFSRERRRSSLTPTQPTLAPPSPSRTLATGRNHSRPTSSDGQEQPPPMHARTRTAENAPRQLLAGGSPLALGDYGRRGSLPQIHHGGHAGPSGRTWNPSLPPPRSSVTEEGQLPDEGFRFGSGGPSSPVAGPSAATAALRNLDLSPGSRRGSIKPPQDSFEETEAEEAERQRRAFLAATYGQDGKRARERLSFAGPSGLSPGLPGTPGAQNLRRQSLLLWEKIHTAAGAARSFEGPATASEPSVSTLLSPKSLEELAPRRGSLPVAIPGSGIGRAPSRKRHDIDEPPKIIQPGDVTDEEEEPESEDEDEAEAVTGLPGSNGLGAPQRPLPPLLPLSDPGPRLLPSTLALHRANHLLNSRNLQADPLPHPLPPSLHPPAPVDLAEFDIDFILAGSQAQLGGSTKSTNAPIDVLSTTKVLPNGPAPTLKLGGGEDEDSFAKFVGEFDDEYGGRRGEWTFRACPPKPSNATPSSSRQPKAEWASAGAGPYELFADGDVKSVKTGSVWRIRRSGSREYELEERERGQSEIAPFGEPSRSFSSDTKDAFILTSKCAHIDSGGISVPARYRINPAFPFTPSDGQLHVSISDQPAPERSQRFDSTDSASTARAFNNLSTSLPLVNNFTPKKIRQLSRGQQDMSGDEGLVPPPSSDRGRGSLSAAAGRTLSNDKRKERRGDSRERTERAGEEEKKRGGLGGAIKRAFKSTLAANEEKRAAREEREREKMQSQSWSPSVARSKDFIHPTGKGFASKQDRGQSTTAPAGLTDRSRQNSSDASETARHPPSAWLGASSSAPERPRMTSRGASRDEVPLHREGKAWKGVPAEAVAMVVPIDEDDAVTTPQTAPSSISRADASRQALLVWYVPFNSDVEDRPPTAASSASSRHANEPVSSTLQPPQPTKAGDSSSGSSSLPKFQKLLRRRASKDKDAIKREQRDLQDRQPASSNHGSTTHLATSPDAKTSCALHPLPFRSFRVVARVVDTDELKSEVALPAATAGSSTAQSPFASSRTASGPSPSSYGSHPSPGQGNPRSLFGTDEQDVASLSTAPTSTVFAGRTFPTVIAVCHSRSQGVEFVLEGLDRLGYCQGESAWGPTGYEEWRGTGLSQRGRELLDLLWAGCVGVMGLVGAP